MNNFLKLIRGRDIQMRAVIITALASYTLQLSGILLRWHLWAIALATLLPWIPLFSMKVLWNSRHYGFMAIYSVLMLVQAGHVGEHIFQMGEYIFYKEDAFKGRVVAVDFKSIEGKVVPGFKVTDSIPSDGNLWILPTQGPVPGAKPGDIITAVSGKRPAPHIGQYVELDRPTGEKVFGIATVFPGCQGWSWNGPGCGSAHGVFGELDRELIHFLWDGAILIACVLLFIKFRSNPWTFWAFLAALIHQIEHIYLFGADLAAPGSGYPGTGSFLGLAARQVDAGLLGHNGVVSTWLGINFLPNRINIHFIYNTLVFIPMVGAFVYQVRRIYDEWLAKALPTLSREQLIQFSANATTQTFDAGQIIFNQGDAADTFYIITKGTVEIVRNDRRGSPKPIAQLSEGAYFGEIGILGRTRRTATVRAVTPVEVLALDENTFRSMVAASGESYKELDVIVKRRIKQLGAIQGKPVDHKVDADPDTLVKSRVIQGWLDDMEFKSQLLNWNGLAEPVGAGNGNGARPGQGGPGGPPSFPNAQAAIHTPVQTYGVDTQAQTIVAPAPVVARPGQGGPPRIFGSLKVRTGPSAGQRFEINAPRVVVGRRSNKVSDVPLFMVDDTRVSREHIEIVQQPDGTYLRDLGSSNGTWLNGHQLEGTPVRLVDGAEIRLGTDTVLTFRQGQ